MGPRPAGVPSVDVLRIIQTHASRAFVAQGSDEGSSAQARRAAPRSADDLINDKSGLDEVCRLLSLE